jgi:hypothetical protein
MLIVSRGLLYSERRWDTHTDGYGRIQQEQVVVQEQSSSKLYLTVNHTTGRHLKRLRVET